MNQNLSKSVRAAFTGQFKSQPFVVWAPGRINIIGEHTDYNLGYVLPAAIDMGISLALQRSIDEQCTLVASDLDESYTFQLFQDHPEVHQGWQTYFLGILEELRKAGKKIEPFNLLFSGNIPAGAGLSSSAALENAFIFGLNTLFELGLSPMEMVQISHLAEQSYVGVQCGIMDQYVSMFGRDNHAIFLDCQSLNSELIPLKDNEFEWLLLDTGVKHSLAESAYNQRRLSCESVAEQLGVNSLREVSIDLLHKNQEVIPKNDFQKALYVLQENKRVLLAVEAIKEMDYASLGKLMYESHMGLQHLYEVSCDKLNFLIDLSREQPCVLGARMMGADSEVVP
ncbi:galactokinase [Muriicola soli]|uniref:Galactokinase n=1 Tax=Muriicola soli TaxID=2507538 RepID=A0A411E7S5_9FLAO|nr:galactokinase [Muriicola soli]QBA63657.1 galactokinase [Muriicola soli]